MWDYRKTQAKGKGVRVCVCVLGEGSEEKTLMLKLGAFELNFTGSFEFLIVCEARIVLLNH